MHDIESILCFQNWLRDNHFDYLEDDVHSMLPGDAIWTIAHRAGVRGLKQSDVIADTLPLIMAIIKLRCKPRLCPTASAK